MVERLRNAGAVLIAKLSMGALAQGGLWFKGMTKNAVEHRADVERIVAPARPRPPPRASWASRWAPKRSAPSFRRARHAAPSACVPPTAASAGYGAMALSWTMDKIGPICRGVEDCAIVLQCRLRPRRPRPHGGRRPVPLGAAQAARPACASESCKRISTARRASRRRSGTRRIADLKKAGVKMTPTEFVEDGPTIRFLLERRSRRRVRRHHPRRPGAQCCAARIAGDWPNSFPHLAPDSGGRVHPGAARAHAADREVREVHGGLGRAW